MRDIDEVRAAVKHKMEKEDLSLRDIESFTAISFSTLSRFLRGSSPAISTYNALMAWVDGNRYERKVKKISSRAIVVSGKRFVITIEAV